MDSKNTSEEGFEFEDVEICPFEEYDKEEAKERASILWLLSKAFDGVIPSELQEPFYRDHENHRRLKPKIVHSLANAELYCLALANIYSDPNYHNLDHHGIIQALMRKGVCLVESREAPLTETVLVQTAPLRLSAHMGVIDGMISLYVKEVLIPEKIVDVVRSFSVVDSNSEMPSNPEEAAVLWINKCCVTLEQEIKQGWGTQKSLEKLPRIPVLQEISDISDGCSLAAVICFYCPNHLNWQDVCWNEAMSLGDSIYNIQLVKRFFYDNLPRQIDFLTVEDFLYIHPSIKENILVFVAELLFSFVIWPASCVTKCAKPEFQESVHQHSEGVMKSRSGNIPLHKNHQNMYSAIPNLRADSYGGSTSSLPELRSGSGSHGTKDTPEKPPSSKKSNLSSDHRRMSPQLHRTSSSGVVNGYKSSNPSLLHSSETDPRFSSNVVPGKVVPSETSLRTKDGANENKLNIGLKEYYQKLASNNSPSRTGSLTNLHDNKTWKNVGNERPSVKSSTSSQSSGICVSDLENKNLSKTSFAALSKDPVSKSHGINIVYMQHDRDVNNDKKVLKSNFLPKKQEKRAKFAALPNTTTWQQQKALSSNSSQTDSGHETPVDAGDPSLNIQLANIRMKLEEKRRKIELEKKRMEVLWKRERQKIGKVAFLQAVSHSTGTDAGTPDSGTGKDDEEPEPPNIPVKVFDGATSSPSLVRRMSMQEIAEDLDSVQKKWLEHKDITTSPKAGEVVETVVVDSHTAEDFEASIEQLNSSLCDLQADISRITIQQEHVENMMQDSVENATHFFLHGVQDSSNKTYNWNKSPFESPIHSDVSPVISSPQRQPYQRQTSSSERIISYGTNAQVQSSPVRKHEPNINIEELYSKVVKPCNRDKGNVSDQLFSLPDRVADGNVRNFQTLVESPSRVANVPCRQNFQMNVPGESHVMHSRQSRDHVLSNKHSSEGDQGFYISFEDHPKKTTTKWQRPTNQLKSQGLPQPKDMEETNSFGFVIGADLVHPDPETEVEMAKKKEHIMNLSIKRRVDHECQKAAKEREYAQIKEGEQRKKELMDRKREEERQRREAILEQYRRRKLQEELEKEGVKDGAISSKSLGSGIIKSRSRSSGKPRPKSAYVPTVSSTFYSVDGSVANKRNSQYIGTGKDMPDFDIDSLNSTCTSMSSRERGPSPSNGHADNCHLSPTRCSCDGSSRPQEGGRSSDGASDTTSTSSNAALAAEYTGPKLFVKPTAKSNRGIIVNAINTVLAGSVNGETKKKVLEEITRSESKHFLILFRDAGCQFRAIYSYNPDTDEIIKMFGIGPKNVTDKVMEKFFKYNSGGKCFSEVHTKHLTVTIDAFTIPNSLWTGKRLLPSRKEF